MKLTKTLMALGACLLTSLPASAGATASKIAHILIVDSSKYVYVYPVGGVSNPPTCHGSNGDYYSFSLDRPFAREYYAGLLAAMMAGSNVTMWGSGACTDQNVSETLRYFRVSKPAD